MTAATPVVDLFAGPGGLGEGFARLRNSTGSPRFRVALSIEKDPDAHSSLELRAFVREFQADPPDEYYQFVRDLGTRSGMTRDALFGHYPREAESARREAWQATLGEMAHDTVDLRIRKAVGKKDTWVLIGGPPCQAYSIAGRARMSGVGREIFEQDHRHYLYQEYLQILARHGPPVFVMENVKGLLSATLDGASTFAQILRDLARPTTATGTTRRGLQYDIFPLGAPLGLENWTPRDYVVRAERFGIPQARHRVILVGVRSDVSAGLSAASLALPVVAEPTPAAEVLGDLPALRSGLSEVADSAPAWISVVRNAVGKGWLLAADARRNDPQIRRLVLALARTAATGLKEPLAGRGGEFVEANLSAGRLTDFMCDSRLGGAPNHSSRSHISADIHRYFFASCFASVTGRSPRLGDLPRDLLPDHRNATRALGGSSLFADRFRVQMPTEPSRTVTSHISRDGHYYIHFDPYQARSLTVREAARLQTFPDNYVFVGGRTSQYAQVGNAVPPLLAIQIASRVANILGGV